MQRHYYVDGGDIDTTSMIARRLFDKYSAIYKVLNIVYMCLILGCKMYSRILCRFEDINYCMHKHIIIITTFVVLSICN